MQRGIRWKSTAQACCGLSVGLFAVGMGMTTAYAPCYGPGAIITESALAFAALSSVIFVVAAMKAQASWGWVVISVIGAASMLVTGFIWTVLLCRGT